MSKEDDKNSFEQNDSIFWKVDRTGGKPRPVKMEGVALDDVTKVFRTVFKMEGHSVYESTGRTSKAMASLYRTFKLPTPEKPLKTALREIYVNLVENEKLTYLLNTTGQMNAPDDQLYLNETGMLTLITALVNSDEKSIASQRSVNSPLFNGLRELCVTDTGGGRHCNFDKFVQNRIDDRKSPFQKKDKPSPTTHSSSPVRNTTEKLEGLNCS